MKVKLKVKRTNPDTGTSDYREYETDAAENVTVLDALSTWRMSTPTTSAPSRGRWRIDPRAD